MSDDDDDDDDLTQVYSDPNLTNENETEPETETEPDPESDPEIEIENENENKVDNNVPKKMKMRKRKKKKQSPGVTIPRWIFIFTIMIIGMAVYHYAVKFYHTMVLPDSVDTEDDDNKFKFLEEYIVAQMKIEEEEDDENEGGSSRKMEAGQPNVITDPTKDQILKFILTRNPNLNPDNILISDDGSIINTQSSYYDPSRLEERRGGLPEVRDLIADELMRMSSGTIKIDKIFSVMMTLRNHKPDREKWICICHHHFDGYPDRALNLCMIWPNLGDDETVIKGANFEITGMRDGNVESRHKAKSTRYPSNPTIELVTPETITVRYINLNLTTVGDAQYDSNGKYYDSRTYEKDLNSGSSGCMYTAILEMEGKEFFV